MASPSRKRRARSEASLVSELIVALALLAAAVIPLSFSYVSDQKLLRVSYYRAVAMEIVDGEMEVLVAGEWKNLKPGPQTYELQASVAKRLPAGSCVLTVDADHLRLEWIPENRNSGGRVVREASIQPAKTLGGAQ